MSSRMPGPGGAGELADGAGRGQEAAAHVLGVEPEFKGVAARQRVLGQAQRLAGGDPELFLDEVDPGGFLGDGVLHLEAGVDLEEGHGAVGRDQEFHGAGAGVAGFAADGLGGVVDQRGLLVAQERRGGLLEELLVPALQGAVAGSDDHHVAVRVRQDLRLDVAGAVQVALHEAFAAAEGGDGFPDGGVEGFLDLVEDPDHFHAASAAAEGGLDGDRQAVLFGEGAGLGGRVHGAVAAGNQRRAGPDGRVAGGDLVAEQPDGVRAGTDPGQPGVQDGLGEVGVLGEEAVAGVDGVRTGLGRDGEELRDVQVGVRGRVAVQAEGLIRGGDVQGVGVDVGIHGDGRQLRVVAGPGYADRDFSTVGDQDLAHQLLASSSVVGVASDSGAVPAGGGFGPAEADPSADGDLRGEVQLGVDHHGDHRVAAGDRMVGQEEHGQALGRDLQGTGDGAFAGQLALAGALQRGPVQPHADPVGLRQHVPVLAAKESSAAWSNQSARGPGTTSRTVTPVPG